MSDRDFAAGIRMAETGSLDGNYGSARGLVRNARIVGAYGFATDEWTELTQVAGIPGANWRDPKAQDRVAKVVFDDLYRKYGDWRLVAAAWHGGEELADRIAQDPTLFDHEALAGLKAYVEQVMAHANTSYAANAPATPGGQPIPDLDQSEGPFPATTGTLSAGSGTQGGTLPSGRRNSEDYMRRVLTAMRNRARKTGQQQAEAPTEEVAEAAPEPDESGSRDPSEEVAP